MFVFLYFRLFAKAAGAEKRGRWDKEKMRLYGIYLIFLRMRIDECAL